MQHVRKHDNPKGRFSTHQGDPVIHFTILLRQADERTRRRFSVNRGSIHEERDPPRLKDRVGHEYRISLD